MPEHYLDAHEAGGQPQGDGAGCGGRMNSEDFSAGDWIDRLAKELQCLAEAQKPYLPERRDYRPRVQGPVGERESYVRAVALDDLRILYARARHNIGMGEEERYAPLRAVLDRARYILIAHPTLARVIGPIIDRDDFWVQILHTGSRTSPTDLIAGLMARASELPVGGYRAAAAELHEFLTPAGEEGSDGVPGELDIGYDAVLFYGLTLTERVDVADGMTLLPFEEVRAFVDESLVEQLAPGGAGFHDWLSVGAAARPFRWRPAVQRTGREGGPVVESPEPFFVQARTFLELLAVTHGAAVLPFAMLNQCIDRSAAQLLGREDNRGSFYRGRSAHGFDGFRTCPELEREALGKATGAFTIRTGERYARMAPIVGRLGEALGRDGRFAVEDRILDVAIALEQMYELDGGEISHKMRTRVAWFLGADSESRLREMKAVKEFYEARSAIVHNRKRKAVTQRQHVAFAKGFDIARRSLFKLLRQEPPDDWDALVVGGS